MWWLPAALAHTPHDSMVALDVSDGLAVVHWTDPDWWLLRSDDGLSWRWGSLPKLEGVRGLVALDDGYALATLTGGLLLERDGWIRDAWALPLDVHDVVVVDDVLYVAAGGGAYASEDDGRTFSELDLDHDGFAVALGGHQELCVGYEDGLLDCEGTHELGAEVLALDVHADGWLAGTDGEGLFVDGEQAALDEFVVPAVLAADTLYATGAEHAVYRLDGDWSLEAEHIEPPEEGRGNPSDGVYHFGLELWQDDPVLVSWNGLYQRQEDGWLELPMLTAQLHKGLAWASEGGEPVLYAASYGGGSLQRVTRDGDTSWPMASSPPCCLRAVHVSDAVDDDGVIWVAEKGNVWVTTDGGGSWAQVTADDELDYVQDVRLAAGPDPRVFFAGQREGAMHLAVSDDQGATITSFEPPALAEGARIRGLASDPTGGFWIALHEPDLLLHLDDEVAIRAELPAEPDGVYGDAAGRALVAGDDGLWRWDGAWAQLGFAGEVVHAVSVGERLLVGVGDGGLYESLDDGVSWTALDPPVEQPILKLDVVDELVAAATPDGAWVHDGEGWWLASNLQRLDEQRAAWRHEGFQEVRGVEGGHLNSVREASAAGARSTVRVRGEQVVVRALQGVGQGQLLVRVDGGVPLLLDLRDGEGLGAAACLTMPAGWHELTLEVVEPPVQIDAVTVWEPGLAPPPCPDPVPLDEGCGGCSGAPLPPAWGLGLLALWARRREVA